jgi:BirA family biotin operon repressor/biotin-[acetyl-CoA-carboxylase] ligase
MHWEIRRVGRVNSTQDVAREYFIEGAKVGTVIVADSQSSGRGRKGRIWASSPGGLYLTAILRMEHNTNLLPLLVGIAIAETIKEETNIDPVLKWPNDVLINGRKVGGVLIDAEWYDNQGFILLGTGVNINNTLPDSIEGGTTLSKEFGKEINLDTFLRRFLQLLEKYLYLLNQNPEEIISNWNRLTETLGRSLSIQSNNITYHGIAKYIDVEGALYLDCDGRTVKILSGTILGR